MKNKIISHVRYTDSSPYIRRTATGVWLWNSGYHRDDDEQLSSPMQGFGHTALSGTGLNDGADFNPSIQVPPTKALVRRKHAVRLPVEPVLHLKLVVRAVALRCVVRLSHPSCARFRAHRIVYFCSAPPPSHLA